MLAEEKGSANVIYITIKTISFNHLTLKLGKVKLMRVHKNNNVTTF